MVLVYVQVTDSAGQHSQVFWTFDVQSYATQMFSFITTPVQVPSVSASAIANPTPVYNKTVSSTYRLVVALCDWTLVFTLAFIALLKGCIKLLLHVKHTNVHVSVVKELPGAYYCSACCTPGCVLQLVTQFLTWMYTSDYDATTDTITPHNVTYVTNLLPRLGVNMSNLKSAQLLSVEVSGVLVDAFNTYLSHKHSGL